MLTLTTIVSTEYADWLPLIALKMLIGVEGIDFDYYECDAKWWALRLYSRIN